MAEIVGAGMFFVGALVGFGLGALASRGSGPAGNLIAPTSFGLAVLTWIGLVFLVHQ